MSNLKDLGSYCKEWAANRKFTKNLYWFKKHRGLRWSRGQNFGDYLSCIVVAETARKLALSKSNFVNSQKLLAIGSVLHFAKDGDVIWGAGVNGKISLDKHSFSNLDVRMVRGPKTAHFLRDRGIVVGDTYGDPGLLLPFLFPKIGKHTKPGKVIVLPNLNELHLLKARRLPKGMQLVTPYLHWKGILAEILTSELVLTSSLHGLILAEAFGVNVRFLAPSGGETLFKYEDYFQGTSRQLSHVPCSFKDDITIESGCAMSPPIFDPQAMIRTFPVDKFI
jgi:pyruvyltransferase